MIRKYTDHLIYAWVIGLLSIQLPAHAFSLKTTRIASGFSLPLLATAPPGDNERLFVLEQVSARIKIIRNGVVLSSPFLNLDPRVGNGGGEQGLLGMAFHPNYASNGFFFVDYTDNSGNTVIARYHVTSNPDSADYNSEVILLVIPQPYSNHNGGNLAFGPDGYLYIGMGDGGSGFDPQNRAQNGLTLLGKILRINVNSGATYSIPPGNPFVGNANFLPEIWAIGMRNPWRFNFDRGTGNLYIADVGQNLWEEIDYQPAGSSGGQNYGWRVMEGNHSTGLTGLNSFQPNLTSPIYEYSHNGGSASVTGGYVYRGSAIPDLQGTYFFADYVTNHIWSFRYNGSIMAEFQDRTAELAPGGGLNIGSISSFGEDAAGELYIVDQVDGEIFRIGSKLEIDMIPQNPPITIPAGGGSFHWNVSLTNSATTPTTFDVWIDMVYPDSTISSPMITRTNLQIGAGATINRQNLTQNVPDSGPAGTYIYRGQVGRYPNQVWHRDTFTFVKSGVVAGNDIENWDLSGWDESSRAPDVVMPNVMKVSVEPNPFNPKAAISFQLSAISFVNLSVYDIAGRKVAELVNGMSEAGSHSVTFDGSALPSGVYLYRLTAMGSGITPTMTTGKMLLMK
jgi:glucose/arabinose dehydrogenase